MTEKFIETIQEFQSVFGLELEKKSIEKLVAYYKLVQENNALLHLVAPSSEEEFAVRHILESLTLLEFLPKAVQFADHRSEAQPERCSAGKLRFEGFSEDSSPG